MEKLIKHNLELSKPIFEFFIKNMNSELSQWIQYRGFEIEGSRILFNFKSSQNSLNFQVYAGVNIGDIEFLLRCKSDYISRYFKKLKLEIINN